MNVKRNENGCPCARNCCDNPNTDKGGTHSDGCNPEECWCDENYYVGCTNCGAGCYCEA